MPLLPDTNFNCLLTGKQVNILLCPEPRVHAIQDRQVCLGGAAVNYTHCLKFEDMLNYVATQTCPRINGIVSDFFQINPENTSAINYFTGAWNRYTQMVVSAKSDIWQPAATNPATVEWAIFTQTMIELQYLFNVWWTLDSNGNIRIEHESYFEFGIGLDLTLVRYKEFLIKTNKYTYKKETKYASETWSVPESGFSLHAPAESVINYANSCAAIDDQTNNGDIVYEIKMFYVALGWSQPSQSVFTDLDVKSGIVLLACEYETGDSKYHIYYGEDNAELAMPALIFQFHRWGRPQHDDATYNFRNGSKWGDIYVKKFDLTTTYATDFYVQNSKGHKLQQKITVPICCEDEFDTTKYVKTAMGVGKVDSAEFNPENDTLQLQLKYGHETDALINPEDLAGLSVYVNADYNVSQIAGAVSGWQDKRSNGLFFSQVAAGKKPTLITADAFTGRNAIEFDGVNDVMTLPSLATFQNGIGTAVLIMKISGVRAAASYIMHVLGNDSGTAGDKWDISLNNDSDLISFNACHFYSDYEGKKLQDVTFSLADTIAECFPVRKSQYYFDTWCMFVLRRNNKSYESYYQGVPNNIMLPIFSPVALTSIAPSPTNSVVMGSDADAGTMPFNGRIGSAMIYNRLLSELEIQKLLLWAQNYYRLNLYHETYDG
jgi:hypothetical protein